MKNNFLNLYIAGIVVIVAFASCKKDLNKEEPNVVEPYTTAAGYKQVLAGVYSQFAVTSPAGSASASIGGAGVDPGSTDFLRNLWNVEELPTDEGKCAWITNAGIPDLDITTPLASNGAVYYVYERAILQILAANDFLRNSTPSILASKGFSATDVTNINTYRAEARYLRAFQYWVLMDVVGNPPFVTENDPVGSYVPKQISRDSLFSYVESELKAIDGQLIAPHQNEYGRVDKAAEWALLARLYLNAQVYTGTARWTDAITYSSMVINAGYALMPSYASLFCADNNVNNTEQIFPIVYDLTYTQTYGGTTYLVNSSEGSGDGGVFGTNGDWQGNRATKNFPMTAFGSYAGGGDTRAMFADTTTPDIQSLSQFSDGVEVHKFTNLIYNSTNHDSVALGANGLIQAYASGDFPLFRLAEEYLIYAEAVLNGGTGGDAATALTYVNLLRSRAGASAIHPADLTLPFILQERQREFYWECFRRTDLVRFGLFTSGSYLWQWKGGVESGTGVDSHYNLYAIPTQDISVNPNLKQNPGYN